MATRKAVIKRDEIFVAYPYSVTIYDGKKQKWAYGELSYKEALKVKRAWETRKMKTPIIGKNLDKQSWWSTILKKK